MKDVDSLEKLIKDIDLVICSPVLEELDKHKDSDSGRRSFESRRALKFIEKNKDKLIFIVEDTSYDLPDSYDRNKNDNKILSICMKYNSGLISEDITMRVKSEQLNIPYKKLEIKNKYTGVTEIIIDTNSDEDNELLAHLYESPEDNIFDLYPNGYVIIKDKQCPIFDEDYDTKIDYKTINILRWTGKEYTQIKYAPKKVIKPLNDLQSCALDLLLNDDIPIKIIMGNYGSGKTLLSTRIGIHLIEDKGKYSKLYMVRNPIGSGAEIGFLPGSKKEKIESFFKPIVQHFPHGEFQVEQMIQQGKLEMEVPFFMKGLSIGDSFILVDEAEDLDIKTLKLIGSRLEGNSCIVFSGDYNQSEKQFINNNGLLHLAEKTKDSELVGIVVLDDDVRSTASKVFSLI